MTSFLAGWKTFIVALVWFVYELLASAFPDIQKCEAGDIACALKAIEAVGGPIVMALLRVITTGPVAWKQP